MAYPTPLPVTLNPEPFVSIIDLAAAAAAGPTVTSDWRYRGVFCFIGVATAADAS